MAKVYRAPLEPPAWERDDYSVKVGEEENGIPIWKGQDKEQKYIETLAGMARRNGNSELLGRILRWQRADGYAQYMVWRTQPLELLWIETSDAWSVEAALIRGLRLSDVHEMVRRDDALAEFFSRSKAG